MFINFKKWVCKGMAESFLLEILRGCPKALKNTLLYFTTCSSVSIVNFKHVIAGSASYLTSCDVF